MTIWPLRLSAAGLISFFACIGAIVGALVLVNGAIAASNTYGFRIVILPLAVVIAMAVPVYCATFPLAIVGHSTARKEAQAIGLGIACVCLSMVYLTT